MKTTLELPDELMRAIKIRAVNENRRIKDVVTDALRRGLAEPGASSQTGRRAKFPIVESVHPAAPAQEMTPDRIAEVLLAEEARAGEK